VSKAKKRAQKKPTKDAARAEAVPARPADGCAMVIFGASGDLTARMLLPALAHLTSEHALPDGFFVLGVSRTPMSHEAFRKAMTDAVEKAFRDQPDVRPMPSELRDNLYYLSAEFDDPKTYSKIRASLSREREKRGGGPENHVFYLATPPAADPLIVGMLGDAGLNREEGGAFSRVVVEKPFGHDLESGRALNVEIRKEFREDQIFRIDHYLGKETVQNILVLRFGNGIFEPLWNRRYVDNVQIAVAESLGVGHRAGYYETAGVVRDMFQNHLLQLLCLTAMESPVRFDANSVREEKVKVLRAIRPIPSAEISDWAVRGQYSSGVVDGEKVPAYREEANVSSRSQTPTYAAVRFAIDNWRWAGVPFFLRSGKRLARRTTEIAIEFKEVPHMFFKEATNDRLEANVLRLRIQPDEGISLKILAKVPGAGMHVTPSVMDFPYAQLGVAEHGAYERLLLDVVSGDATLFTRGDEVEEAWRVVTPILEAFEERPPSGIPTYPAGTWGPKVADTFIEKTGRRWRRL
jgi:glucose-6-phosphate 1-dehydrogenase